MRTSAGIPMFRTLLDVATEQWQQDHPRKKPSTRRRDERIQRVWIGEDLPQSALVIIRHLTADAPTPQLSFYRVDKQSAQCWHIEDDARRTLLLAAHRDVDKNDEASAQKNTLADE